MEAIVEIKFRRKNGSAIFINTILVVLLALLIDKATRIDGKIIIISATILTGIQFVCNIFILRVFKDELMLKRPLIPSSFGNKRFDVRDIDVIKFHRNRNGIIVTIKSKANSTSLLIDSKKKEIENHCAKLNEIGINKINEIKN